jgi:lipopolysaccharide transport system ATP-binding protein
MPNVLSVESISKRYSLRQGNPATLLEQVISWLKRDQTKRRFVSALRDVSFTVERGRVLGVIGHNGAGKSTLLRLLCGLGLPTRGQIHRHGTVSGLLELGGGFHGDLTGRENLVTVGLLNGLTKQQIRAAEKEIIAFAELEDFIEQPVRTYSSGMYLRLAFSVATHFDPDVLILDEVLAVGDVRFQQKCLERIAAFRKAGKTLIVTSHDMSQIRKLCDEVLVLEEGQLVMQGNPDDAIWRYHDLMRQRTRRHSARLSTGSNVVTLGAAVGDRQGTQEASITDVRLYDAHGQITSSLQSGASLTIELEYRLSAPLSDMAATLSIGNDSHVNCFELKVPSALARFGQLATLGVFRCHFPTLPLIAGVYYVNVGFYPADWEYIYDYHWEMHPFQIVADQKTAAQVSGVIALDPQWSVGKLREQAETLQLE